MGAALLAEGMFTTLAVTATSYFHSVIRASV
jgi:hypothetical protein